MKPAVERTQSGVVGVIATQATFQGELFVGLVERYARAFYTTGDVAAFAAMIKRLLPSVGAIPKVRVVRWQACRLEAPV